MRDHLDESFAPMTGLPEHGGKIAGWDFGLHTFLTGSDNTSNKAFYTVNSHGHHWVGSIQLTDSTFKVIARPQLYRRQLHFENPGKSGIRKRKGGTVTPFGFRSGDLVTANKGKKTVKGYNWWLF